VEAAQQLDATGGRMLLARFADRLAAALTALARTEVTVTPADAGAAGSGDAAWLRFPLAALSDDSQPPPHVSAELSAELCFALFERLMGGAGEDFDVPARPLTGVERKVFGRAARAAVAALRDAWPADDDFPPLAPMEAPGSADGAGAADEEWVATFAVDVGGRPGALRLCLPHDLGGMAAVVPRHVDAHGGTRRPPCHPAPRRPLDLVAALPDIELSREQLGALEPGDLLATGLPPDAEVVVSVAGIPRFTARLGKHNGRRAVTITRKLGEPNEEPPASS
jgi:flagellar motor switch protein FliM